MPWNKLKPNEIYSFPLTFPRPKFRTLVRKLKKKEPTKVIAVRHVANGYND